MYVCELCRSDVHQQHLVQQQLHFFESLMCCWFADVVLSLFLYYLYWTVAAIVA